MLTREILVANAALSGLSDEQITAITTLSQNDENSVIAKKTGERISRPRMQVFGKKFFETFGLHNLRKMGYKVDIMHDPNVWEAANKEKIEASKRAKAEAAAKAAAEAKAAEREQMKAEIIAELTSAGVIPAEPKKAGRKPKAEKTAEAEEAAGDSPENNENV